MLRKVHICNPRVVNNDMTSCNWKTIDNFQSISEYQRFCAWIQSELQNNLIEKAPVEDYYISAQLDEQWFICKESKETWRLVPPDFPFKGYWGPVISD